MQSHFTFRKPQWAATAAIALFYAIYGYLCAVLFFRQSIGYNGKYLSDLPAHLASGSDGTGYSLMEIVLAAILRITHDHYKMIGIFLSLIVLATIFLTWIVMRQLFPSGNPYLLHASAIVCNLVTAIYLPVFNEFRYLGVQSGTIYHNSTYTGMKFFAVLVLLLYFTYDKIYEKGLRPQQWIFFALSIIAVNLIKPNFFVCFAPAMAICLLIDLIKKKGKTFPKIFLFGLAVIPSVLVLLYEYVLLFSADAGSGGLAVDIGYSLCMRCKTPWLAPIQTLAFPLWILLFHIKDLKKDRPYGFSWLMLFISFLEYFLLVESGYRKDHGNLSWGYCFCIYFVFVVSAVHLCRDLSTKENRKPKYYFAVAGALFLWHLICGLQYFSILMSGQNFL